MSQQSGELTGLGETRSEKTWDLTDERLGSLESISAHGRDFMGGSLVTMSSISKHANFEVFLWDIGQLYGSAETLVFLGIVVLQGNLQLNGFQEVTLLLDGAPH